MIDVEIATGKTPTNLSLSVADRSCSVAESARGDEILHVKVCHEGGDAAAPLYAFEVSVDAGRAGRQRFEVRARVAPAARTIIGKLDQQGQAIDIAATLTGR
jgi:hypothetical protein